MCGLVKNGVKAVAVIDIPEAIGINRRILATGGTRDTGIMTRTTAIVGLAEVGRGEKRENNNLT